MESKHKINLIKKWHIVVINAAIAIFIVAAALIYYQQEKKNIIKEKHEQLKSIAELKSNAITSWKSERDGDIKVVSSAPFVIKDINEWIYGGMKNEFPKDIYERLQTIKSTYGYEDIIIASQSGEFLYSIKFKDTLKICKPTDNAVKPDSTSEIISSDLYYCSVHDKIHYDFIAPLKPGGKKPNSAIIFRVNPEDYLYPSIKTWPVSGETAESFIAKRTGDEVVYLSKLGYLDNAKLNVRYPMTRTDLPAVQYLQGYVGVYEGVNYYGIEVLAYGKIIQSTPWVIVSIIHKKEIFSELTYRSYLLTMISIVLIMLTGTSVAWLYYSRQRNIFRNMYSAVKELAESQKEFQTTLYSIGDAVITTDRGGYIKHMNHVAERLTGYTEKESEGKLLSSIFSIVNEYTEEKIKNPVERVLKSGKVVSVANHTLLLSRDGRKIPISESVAPIITQSGDITGVVLVFRDQTTERASQHYTLMLSRAVEQSAEMVFITDVDGVIKYVNPTFEKNTGYLKEEAIGKKPSILKSGLQNKQFYSNLWRTILKGEHFSSELINKKKNGDHYFAMQTISPIKDLHGVITHFVANCRNITEKKKQEAEIQKHKTHLNSILNASIDGILLEDENETVIYANEAIAGLYGFGRAEEMMGINVSAIRHEKDTQWVHNYVKKRILAEEAPSLYQFKGKRKDGSLIDLEVSISTMEIGGEINILSVVRDISERVKAEQEIINAKRRAEKLNKLKDAFIANISHEIRTPLNGLLGMTNLVKRSLRDHVTGETETYFRGIDETSKRIIRTIDLILNFSKIQSGNFPVNKEEINLPQLIIDISNEHIENAREKSLNLSFDNKIGNVTINADKYCISQAITNVLDNSVKYTNEGFVKLTLLKDTEQKVTLEIEDSGIGISENYLSHVFDVYSQEQFGYNREYEGLGLGLSLVKRYLEMNNSEISVKSRKGKGSVFTLKFNLIPE